MNLQLAISRSMMFPLPPQISGLWISCDPQPTWTWLRLDAERIEIGVAGMNIGGLVQRHGSILTIRLEGSKPLVAYASMQNEVLELEFVTMKMKFIKNPSLELLSD
jgi:hypothetical protein